MISVHYLGLHGWFLPLSHVQHQNPHITASESCTDDLIPWLELLPRFSKWVKSHNRKSLFAEIDKRLYRTHTDLWEFLFWVFDGLARLVLAWTLWTCSAYQQTAIAIQSNTSTLIGGPLKTFPLAYTLCKVVCAELHVTATPSQPT